MAIELNIAIIAIAQIDASVDSRRDKRPKLQDLRLGLDDGEAADLVMFLYRDSYYNPETADPKVVELVIAKHRNGPVGTLELTYDCGTGAFGDRSGELNHAEPINIDIHSLEVTCSLFLVPTRIRLLT